MMLALIQDYFNKDVNSKLSLFVKMKKKALGVICIIEHHGNLYIKLEII